MKFSFSSIIKSILGIFLFGLALWVNPIEADAYTRKNLFLEDSYTTPSFLSISSQSYNVPNNEPLLQYGLVPFSSFNCNFSFNFRYSGRNDLLNTSYIFGFVYLDVDLLFSTPDNAAYSQPLTQCYLSYSFNDSYIDNSYNFSIPTSCEGVPTGIRINISFGNNRFISTVHNFVDGTDLGITEVTSIYTVQLDSDCTFTNFSFDEGSSSSGGSTIINNTSSYLVPIGYSSLNFGLNGSTYFLGASRIFEPSYLSPLMFSYDFANSVQGIVSSAPLTLAMGGYDSPPNTAHASPIAVIGDTRAGEYELTIALCLSSSPTSAQLSALTNLSNWGFEFNRGYSGQQFSLPSNTRVSYTNFTDSKTGYVYTSVYFYFTTPDYFDSFLIRKAPSLNNIRVGAFAFNKYTGTISDQLTQSNQQWDYQNPSHSSFSSANSSAASTVSAFSNIESEAFSNLDTAMSGAGVNDFNINVISTPMATVSAMINQTYNILPELIKWLLLAVLVIGIFAVIISANNYVNKD